MDELLLRDLNNNIKELNERVRKINQSVFNAREAAEYLRIGYDTILRLTRIGDIEYVPNGTSYIYKKKHLDDWLEKHSKWAR